MRLRSTASGLEEDGPTTLKDEEVKERESTDETKADIKLPPRFNPGFIFMALLALQVGTQPLVTRKCVSKEVIITSQVIACEIAKVICSLSIISLEGNIGSLAKQWTFIGAMVASGLPAAIYAVQNMLIQTAYRHLDYLTFNMLNQTKLLFTALFNFLILGLMQSSRQIGALCVMLIAATLLTIGGKISPKASGVDPDESFWFGIIPVLMASTLSGIASTICQWVVQVKKRSPYLLTIEMSLIGISVLLTSLSQSSDGQKIASLGFFHAWTPYSVIPVLTNAAGGILVGLVTKYSGGVKKGFVNIMGLIVTALAQFLVDGKPPSFYVWVAMPLVIASTYLHMQYPYVSKTKKAA